MSREFYYSRSHVIHEKLPRFDTATPIDMISPYKQDIVQAIKNPLYNLIIDEILKFIRPYQAKYYDTNDEIVIQLDMVGTTIKATADSVNFNGFTKSVRVDYSNFTSVKKHLAEISSIWTERFK